MRFALVDNSKREAAKGLTGVCPNCGLKVTAKCGEVNVNHWAHKGTRNCDPWWENETEWHRAGKNNFPTEWQEIILTDDRTGEKHIADIRTAHDLVIEFQHSHLDPQERRKREHFYKHMVWVVDGTRLKRDYPRFLKGQQDFRTTKEVYSWFTFRTNAFRLLGLEVQCRLFLILRVWNRSTTPTI